MHPPPLELDMVGDHGWMTLQARKHPRSWPKTSKLETFRSTKVAESNAKLADTARYEHIHDPLASRHHVRADSETLNNGLDRDRCRDVRAAATEIPTSKTPHPGRKGHNGFHFPEKRLASGCRFSILINDAVSRIKEAGPFSVLPSPPVPDSSLIRDSPLASSPPPSFVICDAFCDSRLLLLFCLPIRFL
jgi:hypothetical protein